MIASIKKGDCRTMEMTNVHTVTCPSRDLKEYQKEKIKQTLGPRLTIAKSEGQPAAGVQFDKLAVDGHVSGAFH